MDVPDPGRCRRSSLSTYCIFWSDFCGPRVETRSNKTIEWSKEVAFFIGGEGVDIDGIEDVDSDGVDSMATDIDIEEIEEAQVGIFVFCWMW